MCELLLNDVPLLTIKAYLNESSAATTFGKVPFGALPYLSVPDPRLKTSQGSLRVEPGGRTIIFQTYLPDSSELQKCHFFPGCNQLWVTLQPRTQLVLWECMPNDTLQPIQADRISFCESVVLRKRKYVSAWMLISSHRTVRIRLGTVVPAIL